MGMGEIVSEEVSAWYESHPKILEALDLLGRLYNDVTSYKVFNAQLIFQLITIKVTIQDVLRLHKTQENCCIYLHRVTVRVI